MLCLQVMEVEAFCGVHDMIHAAILSHGSQASLREVIKPTKELCLTPDLNVCRIKETNFNALARGASISQTRLLPPAAWCTTVPPAQAFIDMLAYCAHLKTSRCMQIYRACEMRGRIAYKRSGGSRLITHNDHWKSQIRHALYTSDRFVRYSLPMLSALGDLCYSHVAAVRPLSSAFMAHKA